MRGHICLIRCLREEKGAVEGIGKATAYRLSREGWDVCITDRNVQGLKKVFKELYKGEHLSCAGDYCEAGTLEFISHKIMNSWGKLDALINCAGVFQSEDALGAPFFKWRMPMDIMIDGAVNLTRLCVPMMNKGGRIVHITSVYGERAEKNSSSYAIAQAAINQYCRSLAVELADRGILVNAVAPGFIDTPMSIVDGINELDSAWFQNNYVNGHHLPLKRPGRPEEIAGVVLFLAGDDASYITGQVIAVDGGLTVTF